MGRAKDGTADYKIINQLMRDLLNAVRVGDPLPPGFHAEVVPAEWSTSPVSGLRIVGPMPLGHRVAGDTVQITVQRHPSGCVLRVRGFEEWERYIPPGGFGDLFPWRGPGQLLMALVHGVVGNPTLTGWERFNPLDPLATRR